MLNNSVHIIQRQVFELSAAGSNSDLEWQQRAAGYLQQIINPGMEACFNEWPVSNQHLVIDKLEIDLGTFTSHNFEKEAGKRLTEMLGKRLQSYWETSRQQNDPFTNNISGIVISGNNKEEEKGEV